MLWVAPSVILSTLRRIATHELHIMFQWRPIFFALPLFVLAAPAHAQSAPAGFQSPSKNIACQYFDYDKQNILRCDISAMETKPRRPADCELDYGGAFEMNAKGPATRLCHGDTVMDKALPVLGYGEVWQRGGFTCKSEQAGITCFNADRRGFSLARAKQEMF
ncbi:DUF6636 domain-containing protein [Bradyrhizobium algeriense]|uniref:DUF6636 domain-containing protein n=1 Tax=Bradyrhizobium algeriense TaxID=634784 RepID=UPI001FCEACA1|nr:DUF6636 domain-containing protein [Bradyrhizobium algeriense]